MFLLQRHLFVVTWTSDNQEPDLCVAHRKFVPPGDSLTRGDDLTWRVMFHLKPPAWPLLTRFHFLWLRPRPTNKNQVQSNFDPTLKLYGQCVKCDIIRSLWPLIQALTVFWPLCTFWGVSSTGYMRDCTACVLHFAPEGALMLLQHRPLTRLGPSELLTDLSLKRC